jgi:golgin subfamily B member 1
VRGWRTVDEWARRQVDTMHQAMATMEGAEQGFFERLRSRLNGYDKMRRRRKELREQLDILGEVSPSLHEEASELVRKIAEAGKAVREMIGDAHGARLEAEHAEAKARQKAEWEARVKQFSEDLAEKRGDLTPLKTEEEEADKTLATAEAELKSATDSLREKHRETLKNKSQRQSTACEAVRGEIEALTDATKEQRKQIRRKLAEMEQQLVKINRALETLKSWSPSTKDLPEQHAAVSRARGAKGAVQKKIEAVTGEVARLEKAAQEPFTFEAPPRIAAPAAPQEVPAPPVPKEPPPELGELYELKGKRYLAVKTWEQVKQAGSVAERLGAMVVAHPTANK